MRWTVGVLPCSPTEARSILDNFTVGTVAILDGHNGPVVGTVAALVLVDSGLTFAATLSDPTVDRLPAAVSMELVTIGVASPADAASTAPLSALAALASFRGNLGIGHTLVAVAILGPDERPARTGARMWAAA